MIGKVRLASGVAMIAALNLPVTALSADRASRPPAAIGQCAITTVQNVGQRLEDGKGHSVPDSGSSIFLANGVYGVSYDQVAQVNRSRRGDRVMTCLTKIPRGCPSNDKRGRLYTSTNLRTEEAWVLPDAEHMCGGA